MTKADNSLNNSLCGKPWELHTIPNTARVPNTNPIIPASVSNPHIESSELDQAVVFVSLTTWIKTFAKTTTPRDKLTIPLIMFAI